MTIEAKIIADSISPSGSRLTTFVLRYHRFIHSEFMTHRMFSRNASSSRAIPFNKQIKMILDDMAVPIEFGSNKRGMQAGEEIRHHTIAELIWKFAGYTVIGWAKLMHKFNVHKQVINRMIEPWSHISVVVSATDWSNFFALRHHHMAQPEIRELARQMWNQYSSETPKLLTEGKWHLPFVTHYEQHHTKLTMEQLITMSVARCARVSYNNHEGKKTTLKEDTALYARLLAEQPIHASPAEHQAKASNEEVYSGNFRGWVQYRKTIPHENITTFDGPLK